VVLETDDSKSMEEEMKRNLMAVTLGIVLALLVAVGTTAQGTGATPLTICVIHNNADHPSITAIVNGMNDEGKNFNAKITYFDPAYDPQKQASMIADSIARKPDVIVVNAVDPTAVIAAIKKANDAGIPVIMQNANVAPEGLKYIRTFVGSQSYDQGFAVGKMMAERLGKAGNVIFLGGKAGQTDYVNRVQGAKDAWKTAGVSYKVLADQPAEWSQDKALSLMQDLLTRFPKGIDAVYAVDDPMALGALKAIVAAGREKEIAVYGTNGNVGAMKAIKAGQMAGTALQMSYLIGVYTVRAAYDIKLGRIVPDMILAPTAPVTAKNIDQWMPFAW
jgi:ABC-type sugar transport system substrate-binding protein